MNRVKTFDSSGIAPGGRLYAGDVNEIQDAAAALEDFSQVLQLGTLEIGESELQLLKYASGVARLVGSLFIDNSLGLPSLTTTARDALPAGTCRTGTVIFNSTVGLPQINTGTDGARSWLSLGADTGIPTDGWVSAGETWTYASWDSTVATGTFTITGDKTGKYQPGDRVKFVQTTTKYGIITAVAYSAPNTTVTVYFGTDYTLANAVISANYWSPVDSPFGFPLNPVKWTQVTTDTSDRAQANPAANTWINLGSISLAIPIGAWYVTLRAAMETTDGGSAIQVKSSLSTGPTSESDNEFTSSNKAGGSPAAISSTHTVRKTLVLAAKTTYYLVGNSVGGGTNLKALGSTQHPTIIKAICAYL